MQLLRQSVGRMNTLILFGSPKRTGNTAQLCGAFLQGLPKNNTVEIVRLFDLNPKPCNDCGYCKASDGCSKKDLDAFMQKFQEADLIVVASPVYLCSFPAPMKALFDRFQRFYCARFRRGIETPVAKPKKAVLLLSAGSGGTQAQQMIETQVKRAFSVMNTAVIGTVLADNTDETPVSHDDLQRAYALARRL